MKLSSLIIALLLISCSAWQFHNISKSQEANLKTIDTQQQYWFEQIVDHYDYLNTNTWNQRYYVIKDYFDPQNGPVILYICGQSICNGVRQGGLVTNIAKQTKGLILSLEHRYYGKSMPFGQDSLKIENLKYLTSEQALKDLAYFMTVMKGNKMYQINEKTPWLTVGGSYPGALSAWFRYKYPHMTVGAIASSAVILAVQDFSQFDQQIYISSQKSGDFCTDALRAVSAYAQQQVTSDNQIPFQTQFNAEKLTAREFLFYWSDMIVLKIQYGGRTALCQSLKGKTLQEQFNQIKKIALTETPNDYGAFYLANDTFAMEDGRGARSWIYQSCTEFSYFQTPSLQHPMRSKLLTLDFYRGWCANIFGSGVWPYVSRKNNQFGGLSIQINNLFMSNGDEDPWQWASLRQSKGKIISQIAKCDDCAHCQDFKVPNQKDSKSLIELRNDEISNIKAWISQYWKKVQQSLKPKVSNE